MTTIKINLTEAEALELHAVLSCYNEFYPSKTFGKKAEKFKKILIKRCVDAKLKAKMNERLK
jgi:hypothetical protein